MVGIDIVEVARIERLKEVYGDAFLEQDLYRRRDRYAWARGDGRSRLQAGSPPRKPS